MVECARELAKTQPYFEIRYEDVAAEAHQPLQALFAFLDLKLHPNCLAWLDVRLVSTKSDLGNLERASSWIDATPGVRAIMESLGYSDTPYGRLRSQAKTPVEWRQELAPEGRFSDSK
jgi:hypothetical protein